MTYRDPAEREMLLAEIELLRKEVKRLTPTKINTCFTCRYCINPESLYTSCNGPPVDRAKPYHRANETIYCEEIRKPNVSCPDWAKRPWWK